MKVTLISTVKDCAGAAPGFLASLAAQTRAPDEVVIVDGGSSDGTAEAFGAGEGVTVLTESGANISQGRNVALASIHAWVGLALSLTAIAVALGGVDAYGLTVGAVLSLTAYLLGYVVRFQVMSVAAKTGDDAVDRRYFAEEQITAAVALLVICGLFALIGAGPEMQALREGFTEFLVTPEALLGVMIGLFYSTLYVFGTLIYLDPREYTWAVPVNRASSVLAAAVASYVLTWLFGVALPAPQTLVAAGIVLLAVAALSYPQLRALTDSRHRCRRAA